MTIIVWDGKTLAADRFATNIHQTESNFQYSVVNKIFRPKNCIKVKQNNVAAFSMAGPVGHISDVTKVINSVGGGEDCLPVLSKFFDQQMIQPNVSLAILEEERLHVFHRGKHHTHHVDDKETLVFLGSGGSFLNKLKENLPKLSAQEYIYLLSVFSGGFGGGITTVKVQGKIRTIGDLPKRQKEKLARIVNDLILNHHLPHLEGPGDITGVYEY